MGHLGREGVFIYAIVVVGCVHVYSDSIVFVCVPKFVSACLGLCACMCIYIA